MEDTEFQKIIGDIKENKLEVLRLISGISIRVSFSLEQITQLVESLKSNTSITSINLQGDKLSGKGLKAITSLLEKNTTLNSIYLLIQSIGKHNVLEEITKSLKHNFTIVDANLYFNEAMDKYVTRNKKLLKEAFEHAYEFIYNGKNINIVNEKESPNPISLKDLFILKLHKNEIMKALKVKRI